MRPDRVLTMRTDKVHDVPMTTTTAPTATPTDFMGWTYAPAELAGTPLALPIALADGAACDMCDAAGVYRFAASRVLGDAGHDTVYCADCMAGLYSMRSVLGDVWSPFALFTSRDEWIGFGYLGERSNWLDRDAAAVAAADAQALRIAADAGWDVERLFAWANSKDGRWYGDVALGCGNLAEAAEYVR